ncbi:hypothetical protein V8E36_004474 [Tilletia maclaganii]
MSSSSPDSRATPAQKEWLLDDVQLQVAARISLANVTSTTDGRKRREEAILAARTGLAKTTQVGPSPDEPIPIDTSAVEHSATDKSASQLVFSVAELISFVCEHLAPMIGSISKARSFSDLFDSNPGLIANEDDWATTSKLFAQFETQWPSNQPLLELLIGQVQLVDIRNQFRNAPRLLGRLTSLWLIDDVYPSVTASDGAAEYNRQLSALEIHNVHLTESLTLFLHDCFDQQDMTGALLHKFAFHAFQASNDDRPEPTFPQFGQQLLQKLARSVTHLVLDVSVLHHEVALYDDILNRHWPKLQSIDIRVQNRSYPDEWLSDAFGDLIERNPNVRHIIRPSVMCEDEGDMTEWCTLAEPDQILTFSFEGCKEPERGIHGFAKFHKAIRDLRLYHMDDGSALANEEGFVSSLRVLRAILRKKNEIREVHVLSGWELEEYVRGEYGVELLRSGIFSSAVTFFSIDLGAAWISLEAIRSFPNLIELALLSRASYRLRDTFDSTPNLGTTSELFASLGTVLRRYAPNLRALMVKDESEEPMPVSGDAHVTTTLELMPRLEYLTWLAADRQLQHFRVLRASGPRDHQPARLQLLPAIFRPKVDRQTGFWEDVFDPRHSYALFDHLSGDGPRLKYL